MKTSRNIAWICGAAAVILGFVALLSVLTGKESMQINIGTYGSHIYRYTLDTESLEFKHLGTIAATNGSYALEHDGTLYSVMENGGNSGISSFSVTPEMEKTAELFQTGDDPCFITVYDKADRRFVLTADYSGGSVSVFPVCSGVVTDCCQRLTFEGSGPVEGRQESSHIHQLRQIPGTDMILATDLGSDCIRLLAACATEDGLLAHIGDIACPSGSGPRHMEFSKDGRTLYCLAELSGEVLTYDFTFKGGKPEFTLKQRTLADEVNAGGSADIHLHPSGKYLYTSHRLDNDGIAIFRTNPDGTIEKTGYARTARHPRNFMISPDGDLLIAACRDDKVVQVFRIGDDGLLTLTSSVLTFDQDMPSSVTVSASL